jgi:hypothetical protein
MNRTADAQGALAPGDRVEFVAGSPRNRPMMPQPVPAVGV